MPVETREFRFVRGDKTFVYRMTVDEKLGVRLQKPIPQGSAEYLPLSMWLDMVKFVDQCQPKFNIVREDQNGHVRVVERNVIGEMAAAIRTVDYAKQEAAKLPNNPTVDHSGPCEVTIRITYTVCRYRFQPA